jgi:hypothetical protein
MPIKTYSKRYSTAVTAPKRARNASDRHSIPRWQKLAPVVLMTLGSVLLANAIWPILSYELFTGPSLRAANAASGAIDWKMGRDLHPQPRAHWGFKPYATIVIKGAKRLALKPSRTRHPYPARQAKARLPHPWLWHAWRT